MEWNYLGHAGWLCVANGLRILCDPLLDPTHHGGVFEVVPQRTIHTAGLRPDFIVISHAHSDHFDVQSLRKLAQLDTDSVIFTSDPLVEYAAKRLGFTHTHRAQPMERLSLDGVDLVTTPSYGDGVEWGVIVVTDGLSVWNQVDTVHRSTTDVRTTLEQASTGLGFAPLKEHIDLLLARWQPLCEIAPMLGHRTSFPYKAYAQVLHEIAAAQPKCIVPASAGGRHIAPFDWLNHFSHPVPQSAFLRDISQRIPSAKAHPGIPGSRYVVSKDGVHCERRGANQLVQLDQSSTVLAPDTEWRPVSVPELQDYNPWNFSSDHARSTVKNWIHQVLKPALQERFGHWHKTGPVRLLIQAQFETVTDSYRIDFGTQTVVVRHEYEHYWDALNVVSGSSLCAVIEGRACWGDVLLAGNLRAFSRMYTVDEQGLHETPFGVTFLYYGLSYGESFERFVHYQLDHPT